MIPNLSQRSKYSAEYERALLTIISVLIPGNEILCVVIHCTGVCSFDTGRDYSNAGAILVSTGEF